MATALLQEGQYNVMQVLAVLAAGSNVALVSRELWRCKRRPGVSSLIVSASREEADNQKNADRPNAKCPTVSRKRNRKLTRTK